MILTYLIASVWLVNGLFCKALDLEPRHRAIVVRILGEGHAKGRTIAIGCLETAMAAWIVSGLAPAVNAWTQIVLVLCMNLIEFLLASDLLLWGRWNAFFALLFVLLIYYHAFLS
jgi:DoxX-like family